MLVAQAIMLFASVALVAMTYADALTQWTLLFFTFAIGIGTALHYPSWQAAIGDIVARPALPSAVGLNATANNVARGIGPSLGGLICWPGRYSADLPRSGCSASPRQGSRSVRW